MITAVIPVSPIKSHPDTAILTETVHSLRHWLPDAEIVLTFDGVRPEQADRRADYREFVRRALWAADHDWGNVCPFVFETHHHQSGMLQATIDIIDTPLVIYVEQDTPLVVDEPIDFDAICAFVLSGGSNVVRLHHEGRIPDQHQHMIHGADIYQGTEFIRTSQWSQRPHIASTAYYRRILDSHFTTGSKSFIEDRMHGVVDQAFRRDGMHGWSQHRIHIYSPGENLKRSYHTDGRQGEPKWDDTQVF